MRETEPCSNCKTAREFAAYRWFNPACLYCGARLIQHLGTLPIPASACKERRQTVLRDWLRYGHCETTLRALAAGPPCYGPESVVECAPQTSVKTRSRMPR